MLPKTKVSKDLGLGPNLTNTSGRSASRAMPKARLTYCLQLDCTQKNMISFLILPSVFSPLFLGLCVRHESLAQQKVGVQENTNTCLAATAEATR